MRACTRIADGAESGGGAASAAAGSVPPQVASTAIVMSARRRRVTIPDDPTVLSHLLAGILQVETPRRQTLLEAATTEDRLRGLLDLIDRETFLLRRRLRFFRPEPHVVGARRS